MNNKAIALFTVLTTVSCLSSFSIGAKRDQNIRFDRDIRPILSDTCFHCHGPDEENRQGDLRLDIEEAMFAPRDGNPAVTPGDIRRSSLFQRLVHNDVDQRMPPADSTKSLTTDQIDLIRRWIQQGAKWSDHWAFEAPAKPDVPRPPRSRWATNEIDLFILDKLRKQGLRPSAEADRYKLARRVSLDLTGLPPNPADVREFVNDSSDNAYETYLDKMLSSRHFGERMAIAWLDAARYGDTSVFHADGPRDMWAWRDWVVRAYNNNKSFKDFSIEQLAGDLLPDATPDQKIATGFVRNNATTDEGGLIEEEYRVEYIVDRVRTTSMVWLGLSLECAQCHDHKYDPFTMKDYYQIFAYFNQAADPGKQTRNGNQTPITDYYDPMRLAEANALRAEIPKLEANQQARHQAGEEPFQVWLKEAIANPEAAAIDARPSDPIVHLPLDEGKGKTAADSAKKDRKGNLKGPELWDEGVEGKAFKTDGASFIDLGKTTNFDRQDRFSFGCWIKPTGDASGSPIGKMAENKNNRGFILDSSGGTLQVMISNEWPLNSIMVHTAEKLTPDEWQHVFVTYDGSSKAAGVKVYVNGEQRKLAVIADCLTSTIHNLQPLLIGRRYGGEKGSPFKGLIDDVRIYDRMLSQTEVAALAGEDRVSPLLKVESLTEDQKDILREYYLKKHDDEYKKIAGELRKANDRIASLTLPASTVMVMQDVATPRETFILTRGQYDQPSDTKVSPTPLLRLTDPGNESPENRLGLANWLFQDNHPLTSRVAVNRYWTLLFGRGIVPTLEDFGSQGQYPSHPELLDWLAVDFRESDWDIKRMMKMMMMSSTYRQTSAVTDELLEEDPDNLHLARGPRFRLQAEFIRDNALAVSGLLISDMGGPGGKVYQPPGLWAEVGLGGNPKFVQDHGMKLYRRSIYTYWKRSAPPPNMQLFDAPTRERCILQRSRTNTPLQALVLLNDVQYVEAARNLAQQILTAPPATIDQQIGDLYMRVLSRPARAEEVEILSDILSEYLSEFAADIEGAKSLVSFGESARDESIEVSMHAAWTMLCSMVMNLDEAVTRN